MNHEESSGYGNSDAGAPRPGSRPSSDAELGLFAKRLAVITDGMKTAEISRKTGVDRRSIEGYLAGKNEPSRERLVALARGLDVSVEWLATGAGLPRGIEDAGALTRRKLERLGLAPRSGKLESPEPGVSYGDQGTPNGDGVPLGFALVPRYDVRAAAGRGAINDSEDLIEHYAYKDAWLRLELKADPARLCIIDAVGDSMEPAIYDGEELLVDRSVTRWVGDGIYLVRYDGGLLVKQLQRVAGGMIRIVSRNARYEAQTVNERAADFGTDFAILGRVLGKPSFTKL